MILNCEGCKQDFESIRKKRFCSGTCRDARRCKNHPVVIKVCPGCSTEFSTAKPERKWCSKKCSDRAWSTNPKKKASVKEWHKNNPERIRSYWKEREKKRQEFRRSFSRIYIKTCVLSGKTFISRGKTAKVHPDHLKEYINQQNRIEWERKRTDKICPECSNTFRATDGYKYCSTECGKKHIGRITSCLRKAKDRGATIIENVNPLQVFQAYNWHCAVCSCHTPKDYIGSCEDSAPTIDHIIPISRGGEHSYDNTQLLCRSCNQSKGAMLDPPKELVQLITINNQLNKKVYDTEQLVRSA